MHHEEEILVNQVREEANYVFEHFFLVFCRCFHTALPQQFVSEIGEELCHGILADINIYEFLESELMLPCEQGIFAETLLYHFFVVNVHLEKLFD